MSATNTTQIDEVLSERGGRYGDFKSHAEIACALKDVFIKAGYLDKPPFIRQALDVMADKIGRMLNGDCLYLDNWVDIQGYSQLVQQIIEELPVPDDQEPEQPLFVGGTEYENNRSEPENRIESVDEILARWNNSNWKLDP